MLLSVVVTLRISLLKAGSALATKSSMANLVPMTDLDLQRLTLRREVKVLVFSHLVPDHQGFLWPVLS